VELLSELRPGGYCSGYHPEKYHYLTEDDFVTIIDNQPLNKRLTELAHLVSGGLQRANKSVMIHVSHRLFP
jgi:hypothetical protein